MKCLLVFYTTMALFVFVKCSFQYCTFKGIAKEEAYCTQRIIKNTHTLHFIPPISQRISRIYLWGQPLIALPYNAFSNLTSQRNIVAIGLANCQIDHLDARAFINLDSLTNLDLSENQIVSLDAKTFEPVRRLQYLYIDHNKIEILAGGLFQNLVSLNIVYLQNNRIRHIEGDAFRNTPKLKTIFLHNNNLQHLNLNFNDDLLNSRALFLHGNPWSCDCNLQQLYEYFLQSMSIYALLYKGPNTERNSFLPRCESPPEIREKKWNDMTSDEFICGLRIIKPQNETRVVLFGSNVVLSCVVQSYTKPDINWRKRSGAFRVSHVSSSSYRYTHYLNYTLLNVQTEDAGVYFCIVGNSEMPQHSRVTIHVNDSAVNEGVTTTTWPFPHWIPRSLVFIGLVSVATVIIGFIFAARFLIRKYKPKRQVQLPPILKLNNLDRAKARAARPSRRMCNDYESESREEASSEEEDEEQPITDQRHHKREHVRTTRRPSHILAIASVSQGSVSDSSTEYSNEKEPSKQTNTSHLYHVRESSSRESIRIQASGSSTSMRVHLGGLNEL